MNCFVRGIPVWKIEIVLEHLKNFEQKVFHENLKNVEQKSLWIWKIQETSCECRKFKQKTILNNPKYAIGQKAAHFSKKFRSGVGITCKSNAEIGRIQFNTMYEWIKESHSTVAQEHQNWCLKFLIFGTLSSNIRKISICLYSDFRLTLLGVRFPY